jgi:outer membrane protein TolC
VGASYGEQTADLPQRVFMGTIELSLPIIDRGGYARDAALAEKEAATYRLEQKRKELRAQFDQGWTVLEQSKKKIEIYPLSLVPSLEAVMNKAEQNWKRGLVQVTAFLELENQVHEQASKVFDVQTAYIEALSQMMLLAGSDFALEGK